MFFLKKHFVFLILFLNLILLISQLYANTDKSQLAIQLYKEGLELFKQNRNKEALYKFKKVKKYLVNDPAPYRKIAQIYVRNFEYQKAIEHFKIVIKLLNDKNQKNLLPYLYRDIADVYYDIQDYTNAKEYYQLALNKSESQDNSLTGVILIKMGMLEYQKKDYTKSKTIFINALKVNQKSNILPNLAKNHYELSKAYFMLKNFNESLKEIETAITIYKDINNNLNLGSAYLHKGDVLYELSKPSEGFEFYKKGLTIYKSIGSYNQLTTAYYKIGNFFLSQNNYKKAEFSFKLAIKAGYDQYYNPELSLCFDKYIMLLRRSYNSQKIFIELYKHYLYALKHQKFKTLKNINTVIEIEKKTFNLDTYSLKRRREIINIFTNIADLYKEHNDNTNARQYYQDAIDIAIISKEKNYLSSLFFKMGHLYYLKKNISQASYYYNLSLKNTDKNDKSPFLSDLYTGLGNVYKEQKNYNDAFVHYKNAFAISSELKLTHNIPINHINLGKIYFLQKKMKDCIYHYVAAYELSYDYDIEIRAVLYNNFAEVYLSQNELQKAEVFLSEALNFKDDEKDSLDLGKTYYFLAVLSQKKKEYKVAKEYFLKAKQIFLKYDDLSYKSVNLKLKELAEEKVNEKKEIKRLLQN